MSTISATSNTSYLSPLQLLQSELQQEVNSGAIASSDQSPLSSALNDINSSLQSGSGGGAGSNGSNGSVSGSNSSPGDIKSRIDNLIANEVSSGKLTQQQATELQGLFQNAFGGGNAGGGGAGTLTAVGPLGPNALSNVVQEGAPTAVGAVPADAIINGAGAGTLTAAVPTGAGASGGSSSGGNSSGSNGTNNTSSNSSAEQILQQFLQSLQNSGASIYNANGSAAPIGDRTAFVSSFLINYQS